jgi:hypothetical protein
VPELPPGVKEKTEADAADEQPKPEAAESDAADAEPKSDADADREAAEAAILQERERINKENQRKLDDWNEKVKKAKESVAELNTRFGDWYYVVSEDQYKKIQLPLSDLIKSKTASEDSADDSPMPDIEGDGIDAFRTLQDQGLEP